MSLPYEIICGLEVHVELSTATKMFCRCSNDPFHAEAPNQHVCPVCLGLPGALPVPNKEAVRKTIMIGTALGSDFSRPAKWDRKHYFYPDLPKGYQISQYDRPFCVGGSLDIPATDGVPAFTIRFIRAHLEEDAGKLQHGSDGFSYVDLNRAGVPLLEMVTEADFTSAAQARRFLQEMQLLVRTLGASDADMEKGQMRCDVNVNVKFKDPATGDEVRTPITEIKNVNSSRAVERSIQTEAQRLYDEWLAGGPVTKRTGKITVGWDEAKERVNLQRAKEGTADYRYMPEPDLPPVDIFADPELHPDTLRAQLPLLPNERRRNLAEAGVTSKDTETLVYDAARLAAFERIQAEVPDLAVKTLVNWILNAPEAANLPASVFRDVARAVEQGDASFSAVKPRLTELIAAVEKNPSSSVKDHLKALGLLQEHDAAVVESAIAAVLSEHADAVADFRAGNERVFGFLVGQTMKRTGGKAQPAKVNEALRAALAQQ